MANSPTSTPEKWCPFLPSGEDEKNRDHATPTVSHKAPRYHLILRGKVGVSGYVKRPGGSWRVFCSLLSAGQAGGTCTASRLQPGRPLARRQGHLNVHTVFNVGFNGTVALGSLRSPCPH